MSKCCDHVHSGEGPVQTLDELDWGRGIWGAAQSGDLDRLLLLLRKGKDVDERDKSGYTALHYASRNGHLKICEVLLKSHAKINAVTKEGQATSLHRAAYAGKRDIVDFLLSLNADCLLQDADGKTVLHRAAEGQHIEICEILMKTHPELLTIEDKKGLLPLDYARKHALLDVLQLH